MRKKIATLFLISLLFAHVSRADSNIEEIQKFKDLLSVAINKPKNISDADIAAYLSKGGSVKSNPSDTTSKISKWSVPIRVAIEGASGDDFDLSTIPGGYVKSYINSLADSTGIDISITSAKNNDNNVSIILGKPEEFSQQSAGSLEGVPELRDTKDRGVINGLLTREGARYIEFSPVPNNVAWNKLRDGYKIKACGIQIFLTKHDFDTSAHIWYVLNVSMIECLGLQAVKINSAPVIREIVEKHSYYFLRLFYTRGVDVGTDSQEAEQKFLDAIKVESHH